MNSGGLVGGLYAASEWIMKLAITNLLWLLFNIPILFIAFNLMFVQHMADFIVLMIPIVILLPILFFPATTALFASVRSWIMEIDSSSLIKSYWKFFTSNYKRSFLGGVVFTVLWVILAADIYYFSLQNNILMYLFISLGLILFVYTINFFSFLAHYEMKLLPLLKNTFLVTLASPLVFLTVVIGSGIIIYMSSVFPFLFVFFTGSAIVYVSFAAFYRFSLKIKAMQGDEAETISQEHGEQQE